MIDKDCLRTEKLQKVEKLTDPHREYLNMDTDDEDFEKQEITETKVDEPSPLEYPVYEEKELITLVQYLKNLTVLPLLKESDWNEECYLVMRTYLQNPIHMILTIFFDVNKLKANLSIPEHQPINFMYFIRSSCQIYTVDNFFTNIICGNIVKRVKNSILKFMQNIYAPITLNNDKWPQIIKNDLYLNLHETLLCLTEQVYKSMDQIILYVPRERLAHLLNSRFFDKRNFFKVDINERDIFEYYNFQELIGRLEKIVRCWIKQIQEFFATTNNKKNIKNIRDVLIHWEKIHQNLCCLRDQLSNQEIQLIIQILKYANSSSVDAFQLIIKRVQITLIKTSSIITYLRILSAHCQNLDILNGINSSVRKALFLILFIWTESPLDDIEILCYALNKQIINPYQKYIKLDTVLTGDTERNVLQKCIFGCQIYKKIFYKLFQETATRIAPYKKWNMNEGKIFNCIETFIQQCYDIIQIYNMLSIFRRCTKTKIFGSAKRVEYEKYFNKIENSFYDAINRVINPQTNVRAFHWNKNIYQFKIAVTNIEKMIQNLINYIFQDVKNIEEGIEVMYALKLFKCRPCLRDTLQQKWLQISKIFTEEVECYYISTMYEMDTNHPSIQSYFQKSIVHHIKLRYLQKQYKMIIDASNWISDSKIETYDLQPYLEIIDSIHKYK